MEISPLSPHIATRELNDFSKTKEVAVKLDALEANHAEVASRIEKTEETNKTVDATMNGDKEKYRNEHTKDLQKVLNDQLKSPFPLLSTEVRLQALQS